MRLRLPDELSPGTNYKLRAVTTLPVIVGTELTASFSIESAPELIGNADSTIVYTENAEAALLFAGTQLRDSEGVVTGLQVSTTGFIANEDNLLFTLPAEAGLTLSRSGQIYTVRGSASVAQYQQVIDSLRYFNTSDLITEATRLLELSVIDSTLLASDTLSRTIVLQGINDAPTGTQVEDFVPYTLNEQAANNTDVNTDVGSFGIRLLEDLNYSDADSAQLRGVIITSVAAIGQWQYSLNNGQQWANFSTATGDGLRLLFNNGNRIRLFPTADLNGTFEEAITFRFWDATDVEVTEEEPLELGVVGLDEVLPATFGSTSAYSALEYTAGVEIEAVNGRPLFALDRTSVTIAEDAGPVAFEAIIATLSDGDPELEQALAANFELLSASPFAALEALPVLPLGEATDQTLRFTPAENANGLLEFAITATDNGSNQAPNRNTSEPFNFSINITPVNDAPAFAFAQDTLELLQDFGSLQVPIGLAAIPADERQQEVSYSLLNENFAELTASVSSTGLGEAATAALNLSSVPFRYGTFSIVVQANDGQAENNTFTDTLVVVVERTNNPPTDIALSRNIFEGNPAVGTLVATLSVTDPDIFDTFSYALTGAVAANNRFSISNDSLYTNSIFRYRQQNQFEIEVTVTDDFGDSYTERLDLLMLPPVVNPEEEVLIRAILDSAYAQAGNFGDGFTPTDSLYRSTRIEIQAGSIVDIDLSGLGLTSIEADELLALPNLATLNLSGNLLDFEDLLPLASADMAINYNNQGLIGEPRRIASALNSAVSFSAELTTESDLLQWYKNGSLVPGATDPTFSIENSAFSDAGNYTYRLRNELFPGLVLRSQPIRLNVVPGIIEQDSLALLALRELLPPALQEQWAFGTLAASWPGVTVEVDRVVEIDLSGLGIGESSTDGRTTAALPTEIGNLTALRRLDLFGNNFTATT